MGRGRSGLNASNGFQRKGATSFTDGTAVIDLSDSPLRYGKNDTALDGARRASVESFEDKYRDAKVENGATFDANGLITEQMRGGKSNIKTTVAKYDAADTYTHNHPREAGLLGGTFSEADLDNFATYNVRTVRAATKEGTYSISKGSSFDAKGFQSYYTKEFARIKKESNKAIGDLNKRVNTMDYDDYSRAYDKAFNKTLVDLHNVLISGQKQYGYTYTLERSK